MNFQKNSSHSFSTLQTLNDAGDSVNNSLANSESNRNGYNIRNNILYRHSFPKKGRTISLGFNTTFTKNDGLCSEGVARITEARNGNLWFAGGDGICRYDGKTFTCLTTKDGLTNKGIWSILEDETGNLWIGSSNTGLCRFDGKTFTSFSE